MGRFFKSCFVICLWLNISNAQQAIIDSVPDYSQPPAFTLPSTIDISNYCAPFSFLNIVDYWDTIKKHPLAKSAMGDLPDLEVAEYIGWFMDTNDQGNMIRQNGTAFPSAKGTYIIDQRDGAFDYIASDSLNPNLFPFNISGKKKSYIWDITIDFTTDFFYYKSEIDYGYPTKLDFLYWNIFPTGQYIYDPLFAEDTIFIYEWGDMVAQSGSIDDNDPPETWNLEGGEAGIGHAVTGIGYLENYTPGGEFPVPNNYAIVHDNWLNTPKNIAIPWMNLAAMLLVHPPDLPDLAVEEIRTLVNFSSNFSDSLIVGKNVTVCNIISNLGTADANSFVVTTKVKDPNSNIITADTTHLTFKRHSSIVPSDFITVYFDTLFTPSISGVYTIISEVHWDQNEDGLINDASDIDSLNDKRSVLRTAYNTITSYPFTLISSVPDVNQPPTTILGTNPITNYCAPMAVVNISTYWDVVRNHSNAIGVNMGFAPETVAEYIGWFMDTNDSGNPMANNGMAGFPSSSGTYTIDQHDFLLPFIRWDQNNPYPNSPSLPASKLGYDWQTDIDYVVGQSFYENEIKAGRPAKIDFTYWNPSFSGIILVDSTGQDSVYLYDWGPLVNQSQSENESEPWEEWNHEEGPNNIGHAVTGIGFFRYGITNSFYAIVHDNWPTTHKNIAIPWGNWNATIAIDPLLITAVQEKDIIPRKLNLSQNYPNPFNPETVISYSVGGKNNLPQQINLSVYNTLGQKVAVLVNKKQTTGSYKVEWDAVNFPSGVYYYKLTSENGFSQTNRMVLLK